MFDGFLDDLKRMNKRQVIENDKRQYAAGTL